MRCHMKHVQIRNGVGRLEHPGAAEVVPHEHLRGWHAVRRRRISARARAAAGRVLRRETRFEQLQHARHQRTRGEGLPPLPLRPQGSLPAPHLLEAVGQPRHGCRGLPGGLLGGEARVKCGERRGVQRRSAGRTVGSEARGLFDGEGDGHGRLCEQNTFLVRLGVLRAAGSRCLRRGERQRERVRSELAAKRESGRCELFE